ncbi:MAG: response regulator, partial [Phaeodactylibacter sp.]|nr:response regulator [Phaeodactylibacter sp.]
MPPLKCVIVDDEEMASRVLTAHLSHVPDMEVCRTFQSAVKAFLELEKMDVDVLFLDIQMPKMTGLSLLKMLPNPPVTILTTAHREFALEGFELDVLDYLLKPISLERFLRTVHKIRRVTSAPATETAAEQGHLFIKANRNFTKVAFDDIRYVEALKNHVKVITTD